MDVYVELDRSKIVWDYFCSLCIEILPKRDFYRHNKRHAREEREQKRREAALINDGASSSIGPVDGIKEEAAESEVQFSFVNTTIDSDKEPSNVSLSRDPLQLKPQPGPSNELRRVKTIRLYTCKYCGKAFHFKGNMRQHRSHHAKDH